MDKTFSEVTLFEYSVKAKMGVPKKDDGSSEDSTTNWWEEMDEAKRFDIRTLDSGPFAPGHIQPLKPGGWKVLVFKDEKANPEGTPKVGVVTAATVIEMAGYLTAAQRRTVSAALATQGIAPSALRPQAQALIPQLGVAPVQLQRQPAMQRRGGGRKGSCPPIGGAAANPQPPEERRQQKGAPYSAESKAASKALNEAIAKRTRVQNTVGLPNYSKVPKEEFDQKLAALQPRERAAWDNANRIVLELQGRLRALRAQDAANMVENAQEVNASGLSDDITSSNKTEKE